MNANDPGCTSVTNECAAQNSAVPVPPVVTTSIVCPPARSSSAAPQDRPIAASHSALRSVASRTC